MNAFSQQEWAPTGAKWYYNALNYCGGSGEDCGYISITSVADTIVKNINAKLLKVEYFETGLPYSFEYEIMYGDSARVYHFKNDTFYVLYDFTVQAGDTVVVWDTTYNGYWEVAWGDDTINCFKYIVDSIGTTIIDGQTLRIIYPSYDVFFCGWEMYGDIVERIGETSMMFGKPTITIPEYGGGLRCYEDSIIFYKPYDKDCDYTTSLQEHTENEIKIYPNPVDKFLNVDINLPTSKYAECLIKNIYGQIIFQKKFNNSFTLNLENLEQGIYFITLNNYPVFNKKIIKF